MNSDFNYEQTKIMLSKITDNVRFYILETEFLNYMEASKRTSVVLILSGHVARDILLRVHHMKYITSVHIYCDEKSLYRSLKTDFCKVKSISNERNELKVVLETTLTHHNVFSYYNKAIQKSTWDLTMKNTEFIWFQLLQQKVLSEQVVHTKQSKHDFIQRCQECRGDDYESDQKYIDYLKNEYRPEDAIQEYTKNNFLHTLINHAIRTDDIEELYYFRYYIAHLCKNLAKQSEEFRRDQQILGKTVLTLYRGQQLSLEEGARLRTGGNKYIAMRGFLSTTSDRKVAESFAGFSSENLPVVFEITVNLDQVPSMVLADISKLSVVSHEEEILFGLNSTFEIDDQFLGDCGRWIIQMHATNFGQEITNDYVRRRQLETSNCSSSSSISINFILAQFLIEMGQYVKAVKFLKKVLPTTDDERANFYFILADAKISSHHSVEHALDEGIQLLKESRELFNSLDNKLGVANALRRYADALVLKEQYDESSRIYRQAIMLYRQIPDQQEKSASCHNGLGDVYLGQRKYANAKSYYLKALKWRQAHLPYEHPAIARSWFSLGRYYKSIGNNDENALFYLNQALERKKKIYPSDHPSIQCNERLLEKIQAASRR
jgi:tetratricopeptide (TPR) repeat protein